MGRSRRSRGQSFSRRRGCWSASSFPATRFSSPRDCSPPEDTSTYTRLYRSSRWRRFAAIRSDISSVAPRGPAISTEKTASSSTRSMLSRPRVLREARAKDDRASPIHAGDPHVRPGDRRRRRNEIPCIHQRSTSSARCSGSGACSGLDISSGTTFRESISTSRSWSSSSSSSPCCQASSAGYRSRSGRDDTQTRRVETGNLRCMKPDRLHNAQHPLSAGQPGDTTMAFTLPPLPYDFAALEPAHRRAKRWRSITESTIRRTSTT